jgi:hypothetical protein
VKRTPWLSFLLDAILVTAFVIVGRASHDRSLTRLLGVALWPFLVGLLIGWLAGRAWKDPNAPVRAGIPVWLGTAAVGMLLRWVSGQGVQPVFMAVGSAFLLLFIVGWRVIAALVRRRQAPSS